MDEDIVSAMLTAIMNILNVVLLKKYEEKEQVSIFRFKFGNKNLIVVKGINFFIALILLGKEERHLEPNINDIITDIESKYGSILNNWRGDLDSFEGVDEIILTLLPLDGLSEAERKALRDSKMRYKIFDLWTKSYRTMIQEGLLPKPKMWKDFNWKMDFQKKKENNGNGEED
jgi:hypothetical protein